MLNSFFATMLYKPIGKFFYIDETQVKSFDLINGKFCLENVPIRTTALQLLRLPIAASSGFARKLVLSLPKVICGRELSEIEIEELHLLLVPCNEKKIDNLDGEIDEETTQAKFELTERMHRRFLANMVPNFQFLEESIAYESVELRIVAKYLTLWYKDEWSAVGTEQRFSLLCQIDRLLFVQNEHVLGYGSEVVQCEFSGIRLFYTADDDGDDDGENLHNSDENEQSYETNVEMNDCIFEACKICIRIEKNNSQLSNWRLPSRLVFSVLISGLKFFFDLIRLRKIQNLLENWLLYYRKSQYEKWRPLHDVKSNPKQWWQFAAWCLVKNNHDLNKAKSLKSVLSRIRALLLYVRSYGQKLIGSASENDIRSLGRLEIDLPPADVLLFRHVAFNFIIRRFLREKKANVVNAAALEYGKEPCIPAAPRGKVLTVVELKLKNVFVIASQNEEDANKKATICAVLDCCGRLEISNSGNGRNRTVRLRVDGDRGLRLKISTAQLDWLRERCSVVLLGLRPFLDSIGALEPRPTPVFGFETWLQVRLGSLTLILHDGEDQREPANLFHVEGHHLALVLAKSTTDISTFRIALAYLKCWNAMDGTFRRIQALMSSMKQKIDEHDTARLNGYPLMFCFDEQKFTFDDNHFLKEVKLHLHFQYLHFAAYSQAWFIFLDMIHLLRLCLKASVELSPTLHISLNSDKIEFCIPFPNDAENAALFKLLHCRTTIFVDKEIVIAKGVMSGFFLFNCSKVPGDLYTNRAAMRHHNNCGRFEYILNRMNDAEWVRESDGHLNLFFLDHLHYVHTNRFVYGVLFAWQEFCMTHKQYYYISTGHYISGKEKPYGLRLKINMIMSRVSVAVPICVQSRHALIFHVEELHAENSFLVDRDNNKSALFHLLDIWNISARRIGLLHCLRWNALCQDCTTTTFPFGNNHRFEIINPLCESHFDIEAKFTRHLCMATLCQKNTLNIRTLAESGGTKFCLYGGAIRVALDIMQRNFGEAVSDGCMETLMDKSLRALCNIGPGTTVNVQMDSVELRFVVGFERGDIREGCVKLDDVLLLLESCPYAWFSMNCKFYIQAFDIYSRIVQRPDGPCSAELSGCDTLILNDDPMLLELHCESNSTSTTFTCNFSHFRMVFSPAWFSALFNTLLEHPDWPFEENTAEQQTSDEVEQVVPVEESSSLVNDDASPAVRSREIQWLFRLTNCQLYLIEEPMRPDSNVLKFHIEATLRYFLKSDMHECRVDVKSVLLSTCLFGKLDGFCIPLSNRFTILFRFTIQRQALKRWLHFRTLDELTDSCGIHLSSCTIKMSYCDYLIVKEIFACHFRRGNRTRSVLAFYKLLQLLRLEIYSCSIVVADYAQLRPPIARLSVPNCFLNQRTKSRDAVAFIGFGQCCCCVDIYNVCWNDWEPLLENFKLTSVSWFVDFQQKDACVEFKLEDSIAVFTLLKLVVDRAFRLRTALPEYLDKASSCYRYIFGEPKLQLPIYALKNDTGELISWHVISKSDVPQNRHDDERVSWKLVPADECAQLLFDEECELYMGGQLLERLKIKIADSEIDSPIDVSRVGVYFRTESDQLVPMRVLFRVSADDFGMKTVTVTSALSLHNCLDFGLDIKITTNHQRDAAFESSFLPGTVLNVPVRYSADCSLYVRPSSSLHSADHADVGWHSVQLVKSSQLCECYSADKEGTIWLVAQVSELRFDVGLERQTALPANLIHFLPTVVLKNWLPLDLVLKDNEQKTVTILSGGQQALHWIKPDPLVKFFFFVGEFKSSQPLAPFKEEPVLPLISTPLKDCYDRLLVLRAHISSTIPETYVIELKSDFVVVNKSGLPLILKQFGTKGHAAGQMPKMEEVPSTSPLLFSLSDSESPQRCCVRLGCLMEPMLEPKWCEDFSLEKGIAFRDLKLVSADNKERIYNIGVEIELLEGPLKNCLLIVLTTRYKLINRSHKRVSVCQYSATNEKSEDFKPDEKNVVCILPSETKAWHLSDASKPPLMCVRIGHMSTWSQEFLIDRMTCFLLHVRDQNSLPHFLSVEIVMESSSYVITFSDANHYSPPMQMINLSSVPFAFKQKHCPDKLMIEVLPGTITNYNWDHWLKPKLLLLTFATGQKVELEMNGSQDHVAVAYENPNESTMISKDCFVLTAVGTTAVILANYNNEQRFTPFQYWQMESDNRIRNVGASDTSSNEIIYVLDFEYNKKAKEKFTTLCLEPASCTRSTTQRWYFTDNWVKNWKKKWCYFSVSNWSAGALVYISSDSNFKSEYRVFFRRCHRKAGTGVVRLSTTVHGSTRVLIVRDEEKNFAQDLPQRHTTLPLPMELSRDCGEPKFRISCLLFASAFDVSVVNVDNEELLHLRLSEVAISVGRRTESSTLSAAISSIQCDNQVNADSWQFLKVLSEEDEKEQSRSKKAGSSGLPAVKKENDCRSVFPAFGMHFAWATNNIHPVFEIADVHVGRTVLQVDEILLWKLFEFLGWTRSTWRAVWKDTPEDAVERKRFYFNRLSLSMKKLHLSVLVAQSLPARLSDVKRQWNMPLVCFENAVVNILPFQQAHCFETIRFLFIAAQKHFLQVLRNQAMKILGTVDFLGNPIGLFRELSGGMHELVSDGNLIHFTSRLWHGLSNSAAKFTSALSEGVGIIAMDMEYGAVRQIVQCENPQTAADHLIVGIKGFGIGIFGGMTSLVSNAVDGAVSSGVEGLLAGVARGLVGTVAKPMQGILDLATGAAGAAKEATQKDASLKYYFPSKRMLLPRAGYSLSMALPKYDLQLATAQKALQSIQKVNDEPDMQCLAVQSLDENESGLLQCLISLRRLYLVRCKDEKVNIIFRCPIVDIFDLRIMTEVTAAGNQDASVVLYVKERKAYPSSGRSSSELSKKCLIKCPDLSSAKQLKSKLSTARMLCLSLKKRLISADEIYRDYHCRIPREAICTAVTGICYFHITTVFDKLIRIFEKMFGNAMHVRFQFRTDVRRNFFIQLQTCVHVGKRDMQIQKLHFQTFHSNILHAKKHRYIENFMRNLPQQAKITYSWPVSETLFNAGNIFFVGKRYTYESLRRNTGKVLIVTCLQTAISKLNKLDASKARI
ncbi:Vacuolar protein sorting-associated protein 13D [Trichinella patagoniensis]|uniref:Vacuolar protein sorting-associated protein 13D n=1 Tax=Trichinella patagoniensis TaxID=990121 RepID=A0A0V0ZIM5_9BILA|nr:Vacuolar protein sorting-associated protein 13D [Trichinella patagoniensis]